MVTVEELIPIKPKPKGDWDVERIRKAFPVLTQTVNGKPLVYLAPNAIMSIWRVSE